METDAIPSNASFDELPDQKASSRSSSPRDGTVTTIRNHNNNNSSSSEGQNGDAQQSSDNRGDGLARDTNGGNGSESGGGSSRRQELPTHTLIAHFEAQDEAARQQTFSDKQWKGKVLSSFFAEFRQYGRLSDAYTPPLVLIVTYTKLEASMQAKRELDGRIIEGFKMRVGFVPFSNTLCIRNLRSEFHAELERRLREIGTVDTLRFVNFGRCGFATFRYDEDSEMAIARLQNLRLFEPDNPNKRDDPDYRPAFRILKIDFALPDMKGTRAFRIEDDIIDERITPFPRPRFGASPPRQIERRGRSPSPRRDGGVGAGAPDASDRPPFQQRNKRARSAGGSGSDEERRDGRDGGGHRHRHFGNRGPRGHRGDRDHDRDRDGGDFYHRERMSPRRHSHSPVPRFSPMGRTPSPGPEFTSPPRGGNGDGGGNGRSPSPQSRRHYHHDRSPPPASSSTSSSQYHRGRSPPARYRENSPPRSPNARYRHSRSPSPRGDSQRDMRQQDENRTAQQKPQQQQQPPQKQPQPPPQPAQSQVRQQPQQQPQPQQQQQQARVPSQIPPQQAQQVVQNAFFAAAAAAAAATPSSMSRGPVYTSESVAVRTADITQQQQQQQQQPQQHATSQQIPQTAQQLQHPVVDPNVARVAMMSAAVVQQQQPGQTAAPVPQQQQQQQQQPQYQYPPQYSYPQYMIPGASLAYGMPATNTATPPPVRWMRLLLILPGRQNPTLFPFNGELPVSELRKEIIQLVPTLSGVSFDILDSDTKSELLESFPVGRIVDDRAQIIIAPRQSAQHASQK